MKTQSQAKFRRVQRESAAPIRGAMDGDRGRLAGLRAAEGFVCYKVGPRSPTSDRKVERFTSDPANFLPGMTYTHQEARPG